MPSIPTRHLNPNKLLLSKWTAVTPKNKEKHFIVSKLITPAEPDSPIELIELEAVYNKRCMIMSWRELIDANVWLQGWR